ncbi:GNAT family N-acetyltransferase [Pontixanthobacter aestiaquae]|uniref:GNAT family N-acetyltransferase n=1 Tax=Pontixanthobacter aestiaquae TaxID=1509367 RepID=A0A844Z5L8_9SPHN|nr:GNAT family N-acetyltransferase [Pontixanthobacter aestiaquae]MDN3646456.1 GNAT family N-acetyltransferase [Pontixanthobacter aestiaquae]MXO82556.1 GNAT family N-acetyltransferase [Pontixanthobacter aestiaquae]
MNGWSLRLARPDDADALPAIELSAGTLFTSDPDLGDAAGQHAICPEQHRRLIGKGHCLVALSGDEIIGFLASEPHRRQLHIVEVSVHADYQGRGIGAGLMRAAKIDAHNSGFTALTLTTFRDVAWNAPFYSRLGFVEIEDLEAHPRLAAELEKEAAHSLPRERRCAMIQFFD